MTGAPRILRRALAWSTVRLFVAAAVVSLAPRSPALGQGTEPVAHQSLTPLDGAEGVTTAAIGQPVEWRITAGSTALARGEDEGRLEGELDTLGWRLVDGPTYVDAATRTWTLLALDPGVRSTPELQVTLAAGGVAVAAPASLEVRTELAPDEDAPRPARGFRDVPDTQVVPPSVAALAVAGVVAALAAVLIVRRRPRHGPAAPPAPTPAESLAALADEPDPARVVAAIGPLVRRAVDAADGVDRAARTDEEWAQAVLGTAPATPVGAGASPSASPSSLPSSSPSSSQGDLRARLGALVLRSAEVRFSGRAPSTLGARETLAEAQELAREIAALQASPHMSSKPVGGAV